MKTTLKSGSMKKRLRRLTACLLASSMLITGIPMTAFAAEQPVYLEETVPDEEIISDGQFYLGTPEAELAENSDADYLLKIGRYGNADSDASVRVTMMDVTASYGKDYEVELYDGGLFKNRVQNRNEAESVLSYMQKSTLEEYNYSDAIVDGSVTAEDQLSEEEAAAQMEQMQEVLQEEEAAEGSAGEAEAAEEAEKNAELTGEAAPIPGEAAETAEAADNEAPGMETADTEAQKEQSEENAEEAEAEEEPEAAEMPEEVSAENAAAVQEAAENAETDSGAAVEEITEVKEGGNEAQGAAEEGTVSAAQTLSAPAAGLPTDKKLSLSELKELATGLEDDKQPMKSSDGYLSGFEFLDQEIDPEEAYMTDSLAEVESVLNSAYIIVDFKAGETEKYLRIRLHDNQKGEGTKQTGFRLSGEGEAEVCDAYAGLTLHILDDEEAEPAYVSFTCSEYHPADGYVTVVVERTGNSAAMSTVMLDTESVTAQPGRDYSSVSAKLIFGLGIDTRTVKIPIRSCFLEDSAEFRIKLGDPVGCLTGDRAEAICVIGPEDESFDVPEAEEAERQDGAEEPLVYESADGAELLGSMDIQLDTIITDKGWNLADTNYQAEADGSGYSRLDGTSWRLYSAMSLSDVSSLASFANGQHYDYSGFRVDWERKSGKPCYGWTKFSYYNHEKAEWKDFYNKGTERWGRCYDSYFAECTMFWELSFELRKNTGFAAKDPTLIIYGIEPIKRIFEVTLAGSDPITLINENGQKVPNTSVTGHTMDHATTLVGADSSGKQYTVSGQSITVKLTAPQAQTCYIYGLELVNEAGQSVTVKAGFPENTTSASFELTNDLLKRFSNTNYVTYEKNGSHGRKGKFKVRAILRQKNAALKVRKDDRAEITVWDGEGGQKALPALSGGFYQYDFHVGDCVGFTVTPKTGNYQCNQIEFSTSNPVIRDENVCVDLKDLKCKRVLKASVTETQGRFVKEKNKVTVRVRESDIWKFDTDKGIFTKPYTVKGGYREYLIDDSSTSILGKEYVLSAFTNDNTYIPVWTESFRTDMEYSQESFYFTGRDTPDDNVVTLITAARDNAGYFLKGSAFYEDVTIGRSTAATAWLGAEGTYVTVGGRYTGISDADGTFQTMTFPGSSGRHVRVRISSGGFNQYRNVKLVRSGKEKGLDGRDAYSIPMENINVSAINRHSPHLLSVLVEHVRGTSSYVRDDVLISDETSPQIMQLKAVVTLLDEDTGEPYQYSYILGRTEASPGKSYSAVEAPISVNFVVYDPITHERKSVIEAKNSVKSDDGATVTFSVGRSFKHGEYNEYKAGDVVYAEVVTDRKQTNDETVVFDSTISAPVGTGYAFVDQNPQQPDPVDIKMPAGKFGELPLIGNMTAIVDALGLSFGISETDKGGVRLYFGKAFHGKSSHYDGNGNAVSDTGFVIDTSNFTEGFSEMEDMIKSFGSKNLLGAMSLGVPAWSFKPIAGLYLEFAWYHDESAVVADQLCFAGGGGYVGCIGTFRYTYYMLAYGIPFYLGGDFSLTLMGEMGIATDQNKRVAFNDPSQEFMDQLISSSHFEFIFRAIMAVNGYVGVGICGTLGFRGGVNFTFKYIYNPTIKKRNSNIRPSGFNITGNIKFWADAVLLTIPIPVYTFMDKNYGYFEDLQKYLDENGEPLLGAGAEEEKLRASGITDKPRQEEASEFVGENADSEQMLGSTYRKESTKEIVRNSYDDTQQKLMEIDEDHILMVWLDDRKERPARERTGLVYSVYEKSTDTWQEPVLLQDDGSADFGPDLCDAGEDILISWTSRASAVESTETDYATYLRSIDVYTARFHKDTQTVEEPLRMTSDDHYDMSPKAASSSSGDIILMYLKAEIIDDIYEGEDPEAFARSFVDACMPQTNKGEMMYMLYDHSRGKWVTDMYYEGEIADPAQEEKLLRELGGQRFVKSPIPEFGVNNPVVSEFAVKETSYTDLSEEEINAKIAELGFKELSEQGGKGAEDPSAVEQYLAGMQEQIDAYNAFIRDAEKKGTVYAFVADEDNDLATADDRELFIQIYDHDRHSFSDPVRVTDNDLSESVPQFVTAGDSTMLFWLEDGKKVRYVDLSGLLWKYDETSDRIEAVFPELNEATVRKTEGPVEGTSISNYTVYADDDNIMLAWQESAVSSEEITERTASEDLKLKQDIYVAGLSMKQSGNGNRTGSSWSNGIRMTDNGKLNELPAFAQLGENRILMVNSQYMFTADGDRYSITDSSLTENIFCTAASIEIVRAEVDRIPTVDNPEFTVVMTLENTGIKASSGFSYEGELLSGGHSLGQRFSGRVDEVVAPGSTYTIEKTFILGSMESLGSDNVKAAIAVREDGTTSEEPVCSEYVLFRDDRMDFLIEDLEAEQEREEIVITGAVTNIGPATTAGGEVITVWDGSGALLSSSFVLEPIEDYRYEMFEIRVPIKEDMLEYGYEDLCLQIRTPDGRACSGVECVSVYLTSAYRLRVNGRVGGDILNVKQGETLELIGSYEGNNFLRGASFRYSVTDHEIAVLNGNRITGLKKGSTKLQVTTDPYGGFAEYTLIVGEADPGEDHGGSGTAAAGFGPADAVMLSGGTWKQETDGTWKYRTGGRNATGWAYTGYGSSSTFYHFRADGTMDTGWYLDSDGKWYYLNEAAGAANGAMVRGWHLDVSDGRWYYLNPKNGAMETGWVQVNGKWYYLATASVGPAWIRDADGKWVYQKGTRSCGSMYADETTPDGFRVDASGAWIR